MNSIKLWKHPFNMKIHFMRKMKKKCCFHISKSNHTLSRCFMFENITSVPSLLLIPREVLIGQIGKIRFNLFLYLPGVQLSAVTHFFKHEIYSEWQSIATRFTDVVFEIIRIYVEEKVLSISSLLNCYYI